MTDWSFSTQTKRSFENVSQAADSWVHSRNACWLQEVRALVCTLSEAIFSILAIWHAAFDNSNESSTFSAHENRLFAGNKAMYEKGASQRKRKKERGNATKGEEQKPLKVSAPENFLWDTWNILLFFFTQSKDTTKLNSCFHKAVLDRSTCSCLRQIHQSCTRHLEAS